MDFKYGNKRDGVSYSVSYQFQINEDKSFKLVAMDMSGEVPGSPIYIKDGLTMVPMRSVTEAMGCLLSWRDEDKSVYLIGETGCIFVGIAESERRSNAQNFNHGRQLDCYISQIITLELMLDYFESKGLIAERKEVENMWKQATRTAVCENKNQIQEVSPAMQFLQEFKRLTVSNRIRLISFEDRKTKQSAIVHGYFDDLITYFDNKSIWGNEFDPLLSFMSPSAKLYICGTANKDEFTEGAYTIYSSKSFFMSQVGITDKVYAGYESQAGVIYAFITGIHRILSLGVRKVRVIYDDFALIDFFREQGTPTSPVELQLYNFALWLMSIGLDVTYESVVKNEDSIINEMRTQLGSQHTTEESSEV